MDAKHKWLTAGLGLSLALNIFFVGVGAARLQERLRAGSATSALLRADDFNGKLRALPRDQRAIFNEAIREQGPRLRALRLQLAEDGRLARHAMGAEPFVAADLDMALAAVRRDTDAFQAALHAQVVVGMGRLSPESRARLAQPTEGALR